VYRIAISADSKYRDSVGVALLKHELSKRLDAEIQTISFDVAQQAIELFRPHVLVLNHVLGKRNERFANYVKRQGGLNVVAFNEGRNNTADQLDWFVKQNDNPDADLFLSWNDDTTNRMSKAATTGCPRFDIYRSPYDSLINSRTRFCERYGIDASKRIISFMSSFPQSKFAARNSSFNENDWLDLKVSTIPGRENPTEFARREYEGIQAFRFWIRTVMSHFGDEFEYIIKVHPLEEQSEWDRFASDTSIHLIKAEYVFNVINASDLVIARGDCVTHCDSWLLSKPTIHAMIGDVGVSGAGKDALQYGFGVARSPDELKRLVSSWANPSKKRIVANDPSEYLTRYGFNVERSASKCADAICNLIDERKPIVSDITLDDRVNLSRLLQQHDINTFNNQVDFAGHFGKSANRNTINEWIKQIKHLEATNG
jgi:surface carbohydrate biosynthesis protein